jgi:hypothetical protein
VPSSTSSSDRRLPRLAWLPLLGGACLALALTIAAMETSLALRGFRPSVPDSEARWLEARERARSLGKHALVLVGGSRMLLDVDLAVLRRQTGLEPVQLALEGTPFLSVFKGIAADPRITGTVVVDFGDNALAYPGNGDAGSRYENDAERTGGSHLLDFASVEGRLGDLLHGALRSYADGSSPWDALLTRVLRRDATPQYLTTRPDRSTLADYRQVSMPGFYYQRVSINLGLQGKVPPRDDAEIQDRFRTLIASLKPIDAALYRRRIPEVASMVDAITARGGRVMFVVFPESGYVRDIDDRILPRTSFWDAFAAGSHAPSVNFRDSPALAAFSCPDGSHLDYRDRERFTSALVSVLGLDRRTP